MVQLRNNCPLFRTSPNASPLALSSIQLPITILISHSEETPLLFVNTALVIAALLVAVSSAFAGGIDGVKQRSEWERGEHIRILQNMVEHYTEEQLYEMMATAVAGALKAAASKDYLLCERWGDYIIVINNRLQPYRAARGLPTYLAVPSGYELLEEE
jgi:hypothetical protein